MTSSSTVSIGVVGAGAMGRGIAQVAVAAGYRTILYDVDTEQVRAAYDFISRMLRRAAEKGSMSVTAASTAIANLHLASDLSDLATCSLVIEAIVEKLDIKQELFARIESVVSVDCVLASNTSSLSVTAIAAACAKPERMAGFHFFIPVPLMKLVEVIDGVRTSQATVDFLMQVAARMGHTAVKVSDSPGFLVNHAGRGYITESLAILGESIAAPYDIDRVMNAAGFRMGPFTLMDLTGLDITHPALESVFSGFYGDPRFLPSPITRRRVQAGILGRKSGGGWYSYDDNQQMIADEPAAPTALPTSVWVAAAEENRREELLAAVAAAGVGLDDAPQPSSESLCLVAPLGHDATTSALELGLDAQRVVAVDTFMGLGARRTMMTTPVTDPAMRDGAHALLAATGAKVTVIKDSPGFIAPRILAMVVNTACGIAQMGIASAADIDLAVSLALGYPNGPLVWGDALGPTRVLAILDALYAVYRDPRYRPVPWLTRRAKLGVSLLTTPH